jgi:GNAT superfamily N-acetyltransferase
LRREVLRPYQTIDELAESEPPAAFAVGAFEQEDEAPVGVGLIGQEGDPGWWRVRGMATAPVARGRGIGSAVLEALLDHARARGAAGVWASVRTPARSLYERAGFVVASDEFEPPNIGPHVIMTRVL